MRSNKLNYFFAATILFANGCGREDRGDKRGGREDTKAEAVASSESLVGSAGYLRSQDILSGEYFDYPILDDAEVRRIVGREISDDDQLSADMTVLEALESLTGRRVVLFTPHTPVLDRNVNDDMFGLFEQTISELEIDLNGLTVGEFLSLLGSGSSTSVGYRVNYHDHHAYRESHGSLFSAMSFFVTESHFLLIPIPFPPEEDFVDDERQGQKQRSPLFETD